MISGHKNVIVSCLYIPLVSNTNDVSEILYDLYSKLSVSKTIFICGDVNLDILKHNSDHAVKHFLDIMYSLGLCPLIDRPSRITNHSSTLVDTIFTNAKEYNNVSVLFTHSLIWRPSRVADTPPLLPISRYGYCLFVADVRLCSEVLQPGSYWSSSGSGSM